MVAGIELSQGMLSALRNKFSDKDISLMTLISMYHLVKHCLKLDFGGGLLDKQ